jgi:tubulin-specific chaperone cofactor E-like protein
MRLYYIDQSYRELMAPEEMKYPNKQLYSYNIVTGDEIIIEPKK